MQVMPLHSGASIWNADLNHLEVARYHDPTPHIRLALRSCQCTIPLAPQHGPQQQGNLFERERGEGKKGRGGGARECRGRVH